MKKKYSLLILIFFSLLGLRSAAQKSDYKVVFDITSSDPSCQKQVVREANLIKEGNPDAQVEVVLYGKSLDLIRKDKSQYSEDIQKLVNQKGVSFKACHIAMKHQNVASSQLITGVQVVPDGIYEIIKKQREGWGYIKISPL
jgi:intracellular sulfur oxidation DsrE/DsrF family protein